MRIFLVGRAEGIGRESDSYETEASREPGSRLFDRFLYGWSH